MVDELMSAYGNRFIVAAVGVCLALLVLVIVLWLMRNRASSPFVRGGRNRQPRLQVLDAAAVDARRRLVLIRRDNIEHLIMIGGPTDIVIESGIGEPKTYFAGELAQPLAVAAPAPTTGMLEQRADQTVPEARPQPEEPMPAARRAAPAAAVRPQIQKPAGDDIRAAERPEAPVQRAPIQAETSQAAPSRPATPSAEPARAPRAAAMTSPAVSVAPSPAVASVAAEPPVKAAAIQSVVIPAPAPVSKPNAAEPRLIEPAAPRDLDEPTVAVNPVAATVPLRDPARVAPTPPLPEPFPASRFASPAPRAEPQFERQQTNVASADLPIGDAADILDAARSRVLTPQPEPFPASRFQQPSASIEPDVAPAKTPLSARTPQFSEFEKVLEEEMASQLAADPRLAKSLSGLGPVPVNAPAEAKPVAGASAGEEQNIQKEIARIFGEMSASRSS